MLLLPKMALLQGVTLTYIKIIFFRNGNVAYQIKGNEAYNNMPSKYFDLIHTLDPWPGVKRSFFPFLKVVMLHTKIIELK